MTYADGSYFKGDFVEGEKRKGQTKIVYGDGSVYEGQEDNGLQG